MAKDVGTIGHTLEVEVRGLGGTRRIAVAADTALLEAMLAAGLPAPHRCRQARCGRCRVTVVDGAGALTSPGPAEEFRLGAALEQGQRLMCQARPAQADGDRQAVLVLEY